MGDYKLKLTDYHRDNLSRQCGEGLRQLKLENLQQLGKVNMQNSKLDFNRPFLTSIIVSRGNQSAKPGQPATRQTSQKRIAEQPSEQPRKKVRFRDQEPTQPEHSQEGSELCEPSQIRTPQTKRKRNQLTISPQDLETNRRTSPKSKRSHTDTFDASKELEISQNNSTIIQQYAD